MKYLRKISILTISIFLILGIFHYGDDILQLALTPLPHNLQSCISNKISNDVSAQAACTDVAGNSVAVWDGRVGNAGKIRESKMFEDYANGFFGVGTSSPQSVLHLKDSSGSNSIVFTNSENTSGARGFRLSFDNDRFTFQDASDSGSFEANRIAIQANTGNLVVNNTSPIGNSHVSIYNSERNSNYSAGLSMRRNLTEMVFSILPWDGLTHISTGAHLQNSAWIASGTAANLIRLRPGVGFEWYAANNLTAGSTIPSFNVSSGKLLWNEEGDWVGNIGGTSGYDGMTYDGRVLRANNNIHLSPPGGTSVVINSDYRLSGSSGAVGLQVSGNITSSQSISATTTMSAPSFVDSANASYYVDPAGTSVLNAANIGTGNITTINTNTINVPHGGYLQSTGRIHINANNETLYLQPFSSGKVLVGGGTGGSGAMDVNGALRYGSISQISDLRVKKDIQPISNALDLVVQMQGVYYTKIDSDVKSIGFIAQDMEKILPEAVATYDDGYKGVHYPDLTSVLAEAIKELKNIVDGVIEKVTRQQQIIEKQQKQIDSLEKRIEKLEQKKD